MARAELPSAPLDEEMASAEPDLGAAMLGGEEEKGDVHREERIREISLDHFQDQLR